MYRITGLDPKDFASLFEDDRELVARGGRRVVADEHPGFPCRVSLEDARVGEELVLVPFAHHAVASPYRSSGPIFVRRGATRFDAHSIPPVLRSRMLSMRAYNAAGDIVTASIVSGAEIDPEAMLKQANVAYVHVHYAATGCFACRVDRA